MIRRGIISKDGQFRITNPGADTDSTNPYDFMLHEQFLSAQPYFFGFVDCPFAGYNGNAAKTETATVTIPDVTDDPLIIIFPVTDDDQAVWPFRRDQGSGSDASGYNLGRWDVAAKLNSSTEVDIQFLKSSSGKKSPLGCYLILGRKT
jgi:hypothetical protein